MDEDYEEDFEDEFENKEKVEANAAKTSPDKPSWLQEL